MTLNTEAAAEELAAWIRDLGRPVSPGYLYAQVDHRKAMMNLVQRARRRGLIAYNKVGELIAGPSKRRNCWTCALSGKHRAGCVALMLDGNDDVADWLVASGVRLEGAHAGTVPGDADGCPSWRQDAPQS